MSAVSELSPDAAMVLGIASTAMPFARTREDEAERWLRVLRMHGEVGAALQALGVAEGPLQPHEVVQHSASEDASYHDEVRRVTEQAAHIAAEREARRGVATTDLLLAVMRVYGPDFDRVLEAHGTNCDELIEQLGAGTGVSDED
jgi:hypothetical protein